MDETYTVAYPHKSWTLLAKLARNSSRARRWLIVASAALRLSGWAGCVDLAEPDQRSVVVPPAPPPAALGPCDLDPVDDAVLDLPVWDLLISEASWDELHQDVYADIEVPARVCVDGASYAVELELQGSSTRKLAKKSFKLKWKRSAPLRAWPYDTPPAQALAPARKLILKAMAKDQSLVREAISFDLYRTLGYEAPHTGFANLRINGKYWGLYAVIEPVNDAYLAEHGYPAGGRLYKAVRKHGSRADFVPGRDVARAFETDLDDLGHLHDLDDPSDATDQGDDAAAGAMTEQAQDREMEEAQERPDEAGEAGEDADHEEEDEQDEAQAHSSQAYRPLLRLIERLQTTELEASAFASEIDPVFSLDAYLDRMMWVAFTQNGDAVAQNFFLYYTQQGDSERWDQLPWDSDMTLGADYRDVEAYVGAEPAPLVDGGNYFSRRLLEIPELRERYIERFRALLDDETLETAAFARLYAYQERLSHDLAADQVRWERETSAQTAFERLADYLRERGPVLRRALAELDLR